MRGREATLLGSRANPRFRRLRADLGASGAKRKYTVLLGEKLVEEWLASAHQAGARLLPALWLRLEGRGARPLERELDLDVWELSESLMKDIADAASPPPLALVMELAPEPDGPMADRAVAPWGIQEPGNLGAIMRSAAAFGCREALLGPGCADPFSPKALRGSMGAAFTMPIRRLSKDHYASGRWIALDNGPGAVPIGDVDLTCPLRLMVGNEGHGWRGADLPDGCTRASIPASGVESLNAAVAVGIACYEMERRLKERA
jgi:TrmH family RNA methyltransferase